MAVSTSSPLIPVPLPTPLPLHPISAPCWWSASLCPSKRELSSISFMLTLQWCYFIIRGPIDHPPLVLPSHRSRFIPWNQCEVASPCLHFIRRSSFRTCDPRVPHCCIVKRLLSCRTQLVSGLPYAVSSVEVPYGRIGVLCDITALGRDSCTATAKQLILCPLSLPSRPS